MRYACTSLRSSFTSFFPSFQPTALPTNIELSVLCTALTDTRTNPDKHNRSTYLPINMFGSIFAAIGPNSALSQLIPPASKFDPKRDMPASIEQKVGHFSSLDMGSSFLI